MTDLPMSGGNGNGAAGGNGTPNGDGVLPGPATPARPKGASQTQADMIARLRGFAKPAAPEPASTDEEFCEMCGTGIQVKHNHLLQLEERRILCVCTQCWAEGAADPAMRPTGSRVVWLDDFKLDEELWGRLAIPIGLAFFMKSTTTGGVVAMYPSPAGATESELDLEAWEELAVANPQLLSLETDAEALIINRVSDPWQFAIAPIDDCYALVGAIKASWEGISGGPALEREVPEFFERLRLRSLGEARS